VTRAHRDSLDGGYTSGTPANIPTYPNKTNMTEDLRKTNLAYQEAQSPLGGSYTENKLRRLGLPDLRGKSFLDLGCNTGFYCGHALDSGATRSVGVDIDRSVIEQARLQHPRAEFRDGGWDADFPVGPFDVVILLSAIHYARDPVAVIGKIHRELPPGGLLILEGGLVDAAGEWSTDCLVPGWRKVGDRCRHLSGGYLRNHLLMGFDWRVYGPSEPRGGDDVPRFVVHARKHQECPRSPTQTVDLLEYAAGVALSATTIVDTQPAQAYVRRWLGTDGSDRATLEAILRDRSLFPLFVTDLAFALEPSRALPIKLLPTIDGELASAVARELETRAYTADVAPLQGQ